MPGAAERFARELRRLRAPTAVETVVVRCGAEGAGHRLAVTALEHVEPLDHDLEAERVVVAVGGTPPTCLRLVDLVPVATAPQLWAAVRSSGVSDADGTQDALGRLPLHLRTRLLAARLADEFAGSSACVQESVAKLGLALLAPGYEATSADVARFQLTRTLPRWDTGPRWWTDRELALLQRSLRVAPGERLPHLDHVPTDPVARRVVAGYAASLLDDHHLYTRAELGAALSPVFHNVSRLLRLLLDEQALEESSACFRTPPAARTARTR
jgi:hypothetical protein